MFMSVPNANNENVIKAKRIKNNFNTFKPKVLLYTLGPILGLCLCVAISCTLALFVFGCYFIYLSYVFSKILYKNYIKIKMHKKQKPKI